MKKLKLKQVILYYLVFMNFFYCNAQSFKFDKTIIQKELKIKSISEDTIFFENTIHIVAFEKSKMKNKCLNRNKKEIYDLFIEIDSVNKYAKDYNDFLSKIKIGEIYYVKIVQVVAISDKESGIYLYIPNGFAFNDKKTGTYYSIKKVYFLRDIEIPK